MRTRSSESVLSNKDYDKKKGSAGKRSSKRNKYRTDEERVVKEKERRNANNQRERSVAITHMVSADTS